MSSAMIWQRSSLTSSMPPTQSGSSEAIIASYLRYASGQTMTSIVPLLSSRLKVA